jgi:hypothetical protein
VNIPYRMPVPQSRCLRINDLIVDLEQVAYINERTNTSMVIRFKYGECANVDMTIKERALLLDSFEAYLQGRL